MGKLSTRVLMAAGPALGSALVFLSTVKLTEARTTLAGNLEQLGVNLPGWMQTVAANQIVFAIGLLLLVVGAGFWIYRGRQPDFENVDEWSVDVEPGRGFVWGGRASEPMRSIDSQGWRFANKSTSQARYIDVELEIPGKEPGTPALHLSTRYVEREGGQISATRPMRTLSLPILIPPNEVREGRIEFPIHAELDRAGFHDTYDLFNLKFTITEQRSCLRKTLKAGQCYDARRRRCYLGRIGKPDSLRSRLRRWSSRTQSTPLKQIELASPEITQRAPNLPITLASLGAYIRGHSRVRDMAKRISEQLGRPLPPPFKLASESHLEQATALGLGSIAELDAALAENQILVERMATYWVPQEEMETDFVLTCLFFVLGGRMGGEAYYERVKDLDLHSTSLEACKETERIYGLITSY